MDIYLVIMAVCIVFIAVTLFLYHRTNQKEISDMMDLLLKAKQYSETNKPVYEQYWKEHWENYAVSILRVFGKDISLRDDETGATANHKNAILFRKPLAVQPEEGGVRAFTLYGMSYDPDLDFAWKNPIPTPAADPGKDHAGDAEGPETKGGSGSSSEKDDAVDTAERGNRERITEWLSGAALIKGSHLGLRLITSLRVSPEGEENFGIAHLDDEAIVQIINYLRAEVLGENMDIV